MTFLLFCAGLSFLFFLSYLFAVQSVRRLESLGLSIDISGQQTLSFCISLSVPCARNKNEYFEKGSLLIYIYWLI